MRQIVELSASELVFKIKSRELSSVEVTQAFIDRIESVNEQLNAVVQFMPEKALELASKADEEIAN